jgi:branched-chain amino acid transport system ATP-binding protein
MQPARRSIIAAIKERGMSIPLVEQKANKALAVADRGYALETGRMTTQGSGRELLANPKIREAYLGKSH